VCGANFKTWRDGFAATPRKADFAWTVLARIMSFAKDRGSITTNPCERGGRLYVADRTDKLWGEQEIAALLAVASPEIKLALVLALWTGQRQGDLLRMPWSAYDGSHLRQSASVSGLTFHDLGGSAVVHLALAEATVPQIATFTGHSLEDVEAILDAHYLGRDVQLAEAAVLKLEKRTKL
jgi:hypothetical protein